MLLSRLLRRASCRLRKEAEQYTVVRNARHALQYACLLSITYSSILKLYNYG